MTSCDLAPEIEEASIIETQKTLKPLKVEELSNVPFASKSTLSKINEDPNMIKWQAIRMLAYYELQAEHTYKEGWVNVTLSKRPVIVYGSDSKPKYYEFIVQNESGTGVGVLTARATKDKSGVISHVLPYLPDYTTFTTKGEQYKVIANGYPQKALGILGKAGDKPSAVVDPNNGELVQLQGEISNFLMY